MTTQFVYDEAGHLLEEANGSGAVQKEYIWLDDMPVAMVDSTGTSPVLYFIHADQLGTPQKVTDGSMNVIWDGVFDPFGTPASGASLALMNLRFPGQYFDAEDTLNQNWNRDYDPATGRFVQSDPIGLAGSINTYSYTENNPIVGSDFDGLQSLRIFRFRAYPLLKPNDLGVTPAEMAWGRYLSRRIENALEICERAIARDPPKQCWLQYENDTKICNKLKTPSLRARCRESASERQAYCIRTKGEVGWPPLLTR